MESDAYLNVFSTKKSGWSGLQISLRGRKQVTKDGSDLREIVMMDIGTTINLFGNTNMITNSLKAEIHMKFLTNSGSQIID